MQPLPGVGVKQVPAVHRTVVSFTSELLTSNVSARRGRGSTEERWLAQLTVPSTTAIDSHVSKPFFSPTLSFLSMFIIIVYTELYVF